jgi:hypothetical protein
MVELSPFKIQEVSGELKYSEYLELIKSLRIPCAKNHVNRHDTEHHLTPAKNIVQNYNKDFMYNIADMLSRPGNINEKTADFITFELSTFLYSCEKQNLLIRAGKDSAVELITRLLPMFNLDINTIDTGLRLLENLVELNCDVFMPKTMQNLRKVG